MWSLQHPWMPVDYTERGLDEAPPWLPNVCSTLALCWEPASRAESWTFTPKEHVVGPELPLHPTSPCVPSQDICSRPGISDPSAVRITACILLAPQKDCEFCDRLEGIPLTFDSPLCQALGGTCLLRSKELGTAQGLGRAPSVSLGHLLETHRWPLL